MCRFRLGILLMGIGLLVSGCASSHRESESRRGDLVASPEPYSVAGPGSTLGSGARTGKALPQNPLLSEGTGWTPARMDRSPAQPSSAPTPAPAPSPTPSPLAEVKKPEPTPARKIVQKPSRQASGSGTSADSSSNKHRKKSWAELARIYNGNYVLRGQGNRHRVALTFDDAPDKRYTESILTILRENGVKATFFIVGSMAEDNPDLVKRIKREGHVIGNHTSHHRYLPKLSQEDFESEVEANEKQLESLIGYKPKLLRPPYGEIAESQLQWAAREHYLVVNWDVDSRDWSGLDETGVLHNIVPHVHNGAIILQHAGSGPKGNLAGTVKALPKLIRQLKQDGYELVTLPELLGVPEQR